MTTTRRYDDGTPVEQGSQRRCGLRPGQVGRAQTAHADKSPFTVVANVLADGRPERVVAQPATPVATCFAGWLATNTLPQPPALEAEPAYPIGIDVSIVP